MAVDLAITREMRELPPALDGFITQYTAHHLTQIVLREGRESPRYGEAIQALNGLMADLRPGRAGRAAGPPAGARPAPD